MADEKLKWVKPLLVAVIAALVGVVAFQNGSARAQALIAEVRADSAALHAELDAVREEVERRDATRDELRAIEDSVRATFSELRDSIAATRAGLAAERRDIYTLRPDVPLHKRFLDAFPEYQDAFRATTFEAPNGFGEVEYFMLPLGTTTGILDLKARAEAAENIDAIQSTLLVAQDSVILLKDQIERLGVENELALSDAVTETTARYDSITQSYIRELERPALNFEVPNRWFLFGGAAAGVVLGTVIR